MMDNKDKTRVFKYGKIRSYCEYALFMMLIGIIRLLPECIVYACASAVARFIMLLPLKHKARLMENVLFAGIVKTKKEAREFCKKNFIHIAKVVCDMALNSKYVNQKTFEQHVTSHAFFPPEVVDFTFGRAPGETRARQVIVATAHYGNWEVAGNMFGFMSGRCLISVMRALDNPLVGDWVYDSRQSDLHHIVPQNGALKALLTAASRGDSLCFVADQHAKMRDGVRAKFFGHDVCVHASLAKLHLKTGIPIIVGGCRRLDDKHNFSFDGVGLIDYKPTDNHEADIHAVTQLYMDAVERLVRIAPEQWVWAHRRFIALRPDSRDKAIRYDTNEGPYV